MIADVIRIVSTSVVDFILITVMVLGIAGMILCQIAAMRGWRTRR